MDVDYLLTALYMLGAVEFLFTQYELNVRVKANRVALVGMSSALHAEFERSLLWQQELRKFSVFITDVRSQYHASLGLGVCFRIDSSRRQKRRSMSSRGRSFARGRSIQGRVESFPYQQNAPFSSSLPINSGRGRGTQVGCPRSLVDIASLRSQ